MLKIDVEGFEANVIAGSQDLLKRPSLQAVLIELNGLGTHYGFCDIEIHMRLLDEGFLAVEYEPFSRQLTTVSGPRTSGNSLYVRDPSALNLRLAGGRAVRIVNTSL